MSSTEAMILNNLLHEKQYADKVLPFLTPELFDDPDYQTVFRIIQNYHSQYNNIPSSDTMIVEVDELTIPEKRYEAVKELVDALQDAPADNIEFQWLIDKTEEWYKERSIHNALMESVSILDDDKAGKTQKLGKTAIPELLKEALGKSFDNRLGHDYLEDADARFDYYHKKYDKIPLDLAYFNSITNGGPHSKTLNVLMAGTNVGKTLGLCHLAAHYIRQGFDVLYITLEVREEEIAKRIDANLLDMKLDQLLEVPRIDFDRRIAKLKQGSLGKLIIREYPTSTAGAGHFNYLLSELELKQNFKPKVILVDYMNICTCMRYKKDVAPHEAIKAISEELRGLAVQRDVVMWTATQLNRGGFGKSSIDLTDIADSFASTFGVDLVLGMVVPEGFAEMDQILVIQLKNRFGDKRKFNKFTIGVDYDKQRLYDVDQTKEVAEDEPVMDKTAIGQREKKFGKREKTGWT